MKSFFLLAVQWAGVCSLQQFQYKAGQPTVATLPVSKHMAPSLPLCAIQCLNTNCPYFTFNNSKCEMYALLPGNNTAYWQRPVTTTTNQLLPTSSTNLAPTSASSIISPLCSNYTCLWRQWFDNYGPLTVDNSSVTFSFCNKVCLQYGNCAAFTHDRYVLSLIEFRKCYIYAVMDKTQISLLKNYTLQSGNVTTCFCQVYPSVMTFYPSCTNMTGNYSLELGNPVVSKFDCTCGRSFLTSSSNTYFMPVSLITSFQSCVALCYNPTLCWGVSYQEANKTCQIATASTSMLASGSQTINCIRI